MDNKIKSVLDLSKYKVGETAYWVVHRLLSPPVDAIPESDSWLAYEHPKHLFKLKYQKWVKNVAMPKLHCIDFINVVNLISGVFQVEDFKVGQITRSLNTGEFIYMNDLHEWAPEDILYNNRDAAERERIRVINMIKKWGDALF